MKTLLEGIRVLDFSSVISGPTAGSILADLGAEVIKVESPGVGDPSRYYSPFYESGRSGVFLNYNRNKKSITLNLRDPRCVEVAKRLYVNADVIIENFKTGTMDKLGVGYGVAKSVNPGIVYAAITGYGQDGPYARRPCMDIVCEGMSGLMSINGYADGAPTKVGFDAVDISSGLYTAIGVLAALNNRAKTGKGQFIDVGMLDVAVSLLQQNIQVADTTKDVPKRWGSGSPTGAPCNAYKTKDGYGVLVAGPQEMFQRLCHLAGRPDMAEDPRYDSMKTRNINRADVDAMVSNWAATVTTDEFCRALEENSIAGGPVLDVCQMMEHPQVVSRGSVVELEDVTGGKVKVHAFPLRFSDAETPIRTTAPVLGEHNDELYAGAFGFAAEEIEQLKSEGLI